MIRYWPTLVGGPSEGDPVFHHGRPTHTMPLADDGVEDTVLSTECVYVPQRLGVPGGVVLEFQAWDRLPPEESQARMWELLLERALDGAVP